MVYLQCLGIPIHPLVIMKHIRSECLPLCWPPPPSVPQSSGEQGSPFSGILLRDTARARGRLTSHLQGKQGNQKVP